MLLQLQALSQQLLVFLTEGGFLACRRDTGLEALSQKRQCILSCKLAKQVCRQTVRRMPSSSLRGDLHHMLPKLLVPVVPEQTRATLLHLTTPGADAILV